MIRQHFANSDLSSLFELLALTLPLTLLWLPVKNSYHSIEKCRYSFSTIKSRFSIQNWRFGIIPGN